MIKPETKLVKKIKDYLSTYNNAMFLKIHGGPFQQPGISDLIGIIDGRFVAIEVKMPDAKRGLTLLQKDFIDKVISCGGVAFCARCIEDVMIEFMSYGIELEGKRSV